MVRGRCRGVGVGVGVSSNLGTRSLYIGVVEVGIGVGVGVSVGVGVGVVRGLYIGVIMRTSKWTSLLYIVPPKLLPCRSQNPSHRPPFYGHSKDDYQGDFYQCLSMSINVKNLLIR